MKTKPIRKLQNKPQCLTHLSSNDKDTSLNNSKRKLIHARPAHMYNLLALHTQDRSAMPLPLSAGKQQTRELTPSKIITITINTDNYQGREVDGQWGRMEQSTQVSMGHTVITNNNRWNHPISHAYGA